MDTRGYVAPLLLLMATSLLAAENAKPTPAHAPFNVERAKKHQKQWAEYLGQPVELTNSIGMRLLLIPPGEFLMGSPKNERLRGSKETQHRVRITKPFYLGAYEVTQAEYRQVMGANPSRFSRTGSRSRLVTRQDTLRFPVENVSWNDAVAFGRKMSARESQTGRVYRLPSEAEWEYACRAGTTTPFHFGSILNGREANCKGNSHPYGTSEPGPFLNRPAVVGSYIPNSFGLYDMHGNVWEWCQDWCDADYYHGSPLDDPLGPTSASYRIYRGGTWCNIAWVCRSACRNGGAPSSRLGSLGFRVAIDVPDKNVETGGSPGQ
jgi:formylglycine-generating enzyme required for sulfatase activity